MEAAKPQTKRANRILALATQADWGGVQSFLIRFCDALMRQGRDVLLAAGGEGELWEEAEKAGIPFRRLKYTVREINPLKDIKAIREIKKIIDEYCPEAVHLNSSKMGVIGSLACSLAKVKPWTVYRIGGWAFKEPLPAWQRWIYQTAERLTAKFKDVIILVHPGDAETASKLAIRPKHWCVTVPNGLDVPNFVSRLLTRIQAKQILHLPENSFVFGTVANAYASKGLIPYLDVLERVLKEDRNSFAVIMGDGPLFEAIKAKKEKSEIKDRLILTGHRNDTPELYAAFDVFVLPSKKEGMPWTILEAMSASLPTIAADVGACKWMLTGSPDGDAGLIVSKEDPLSLAIAMRRLRTNKEERRGLALAAFTSVNKRFSWKNTLKGNTDALDKVAPV